MASSADESVEDQEEKESEEEDESEEEEVSDEEEESDDEEPELQFRVESDDEATEDATPPPRAEGAGVTCRPLTPREVSRMQINARMRQRRFAQTMEAKERAAASSEGEVAASAAAAEGEEGGELVADESGGAVAEGQHEGSSDNQLKKQKSLYVCTGCDWFGTARTLGLTACIKGSTSSNKHASRRTQRSKQDATTDMTTARNRRTTNHVDTRSTEGDTWGSRTSSAERTPTQ